MMMRDSDRPWLRRDTIFASAPGGVLISNATTGCEIAGESAYELFSRVFPLFNGQATVGEIKGAVAERNWKLIEAIAAPLEEKGFLRWIPESDYELLDNEKREKYADQIAFLAQFTDAPHEAFLAFNQAEILVVGSDEVADSLQANLIDNGAELVTSAESFAVDQFEELAPDLTVLGPTALSGIDHLRKAGVPFLGVCPAGDYLWALPVGWTEGSASWHSADSSLRRGSMGKEWAEAIEQAQAGQPQWTSATSSQAVQRLFGALLAYEVFKGITGAITPETSEKILAFNALTGATSTHPMTPIYSEVSREVHAQLAGAHPEDAGSETPASIHVSHADEYDDVWAPLVDRFTMPAFDFDDLDIDQVPVKVSLVETATGKVFAASPWTTADARIEALARAYGQSLSWHCTWASDAPRVVGIGTTRADAIRRGVEATVRREMLSGSGLTEPVQSVLGGRLGTFVSDVAEGSLEFFAHDPLAGQHVAIACCDEYRAVGAGSSQEEAQARAAIEVLGRRQVGLVDTGDAQPIGGEVALSTARIGQWHVAVVAPAGSRACADDSALEAVR